MLPFSANWQPLTTGIVRRSGENHDDKRRRGQLRGRIKGNARFLADAMPLRCKRRHTLPPQRQDVAGHSLRLPGG